VTTTDKDDRMPPEGEGSMLNPEQVAKLKAWLTAGAPAPANEQPEADPRAHWAYQVPNSSGQSMDALLAARLTSKKLKPQPEAAPELWLRREGPSRARVDPLVGRRVVPGRQMGAGYRG
jgi:hypothetical protein